MGTRGTRRRRDSGANSRSPEGGCWRWAAEGGVRLKPGLAGSAIQPLALGPGSLFPHLAPEDRIGRVPARIWRVLRESGRTEKEVRVSETYGFLHRNYRFLEPSLPLTLLFIFARCVCLSAFIYFQKQLPFLKLRLERALPRAGPREAGPPEAVRCSGCSGGCSCGQPRL